jgi:hypothetical protein
MTQVQEVFTDTTMENPARFRDFFRKHSLEWSHGELDLSGEANSTVVGSRVLESKTFPDKPPAAIWEHWWSDAGWSTWPKTDFFVHRDQCLYGETNPTIGGARDAATSIEVWHPCPRSYFYALVSHGHTGIIRFRREHPIVIELYDLLKDDSSSEDEEKLTVKRNSVLYAVRFAKNILRKANKSPVVDLHPDGEASLTWRSNRGIINIAFREDGIATYAAYLVLTE